MFWKFALKFGCCLGGFFSVLGVIGNCVCFQIANSLPHSTSAIILKHLAIWDIFSAFIGGFLHLGFRFFEINLQNYSVSLVNGTFSKLYGKFYQPLLIVTHSLYHKFYTISLSKFSGKNFLLKTFSCIFVHYKQIGHLQSFKKC